MLTVFWQFLVLGLCSFGGPAAHIGYFQQAFVVKNKWLNNDDFTQAIALCQFLPGPASSQLGMYIGYKKAGYLGNVPPDPHQEIFLRRMSCTAFMIASGVAGASRFGTRPGLRLATASLIAQNTALASMTGGSPTAFDR